MNNHDERHALTDFGFVISLLLGGLLASLAAIGIAVALS